MHAKQSNLRQGRHATRLALALTCAPASMFAGINSTFLVLLLPFSCCIAQSVDYFTLQASGPGRMGQIDHHSHANQRARWGAGTLSPSHIRPALRSPRSAVICFSRSLLNLTQPSQSQGSFTKVPLLGQPLEWVE
ncbi:hypothetical protein V2G26_003557 [Clonostachys chloroleuca]